MVKVKVIADSIHGVNRLTTMELEYPRMVHEHLLTHRVFSRNASSSRAQPTKKVRNALCTNSVQPLVWTSNQPGMQGGSELTGWRLAYAKLWWGVCARVASFGAGQMAWAGLHKQYANRPTDYIQNIKVVVSSTEWDNFFNLRIDKDAQPEIRMLAYKMRLALEHSTPVRKQTGEWHLPYVTDTDVGMNNQLITSAARCCRVSYGTFTSERQSTMEQDTNTYKKLVNSGKLHASPLEHAARAGISSGNFQGWEQLRHMVEDGSIDPLSF